MDAAIAIAHRRMSDHGGAIRQQPAMETALEECFRFCLEDGSMSSQIQQTQLTEDGWRVWWRPVRPIPQDEDFFENVWRQYRENQNIF